MTINFIRMKRMYILTIAFLLMSSVNIYAKPKWLKMLESKNPNYFKAVKSFEKYWTKHFIPGEEEEESYHKEEKKKKEEEEENDPRPNIVRLFQSEERAKERSNELNVQYKNFQKWRLAMLPFVKSDGTIMTSEEQLEAWKQLRKF